MLKWKEEYTYEGGCPAVCLYNTGSMVADDSRGATADDSPMLLVTGTDEKEYGAYLDKLCRMGFVKSFENHTAAVDCCQLRKDGVLLYAYYTRASGEVRVIEDRASIALDDFSYTCEIRDSAEIYQYGLYYDPQNGHSPTTINCGMFYIIRLADNRLVLIDGGHCLQCSAEAVEGMYRFLHRITGIAEGDKIHISHMLTMIIWRRA